MTYMTRN